MAAPPIEEVRQRLAAADWEAVRRTMKVAAFDIMKQRNHDRADSAVNAAVTAVYEGVRSRETGGRKGRLWNPETHPDLAAYMVDVMKSCLSHERNDAYHRHHVALAPAVERTRAASAGTPEQLLRAGAKIKRGSARIEAACARLDETAQEILKELENGYFDPTEFAERKGLSKNDVKVARERAKYHLMAVIDADPESSDSMPAAPAIYEAERFGGDEESDA